MEHGVVLDASALLAWLHDEPGGDQVEALLEVAVMSAVNWSEVLQKSVARGVAVEGLREDLEALGLQIEPFTIRDAEIAAGSGSRRDRSGFRWPTGPVWPWVYDWDGRSLRLIGPGRHWGARYALFDRPNLSRTSKKSAASRACSWPDSMAGALRGSALPQAAQEEAFHFGGGQDAPGVAEFGMERTTLPAFETGELVGNG